MLRAVMATELDVASVQQSHFCGPITDKLATRRYPGLSFAECMLSFDSPRYTVSCFSLQVK